MLHQLHPFVRISLENESMRILGFSQIFARRKVCSSTFGVTDFCLRQRLWISLAVYSSGNIAFNRGRRFEEIRSDLFPLSSIVSPFAICLRRGKRQGGGGGEEIGGRGREEESRMYLARKYPERLFASRRSSMGSCKVR